MNVLILAHGDPPSEDLLTRLRQEADLFIATDGAANHLENEPDVVLGDFDSLSVEAKTRFPSANFVHAPDQDSSDLDKAIAYAVNQGATRITILGAAGGRVDHALTHVSLLVKYADSDIRLLDDSGETRLIQGIAEIEGEIGDTLSLIAFAHAEGVSAEGVRWPLKEETLLPGSRGVSNVMTEPVARISLRSGFLIACHLTNQNL